jgi:ribosomal protein S12 methylthiotransferase
MRSKKEKVKIITLGCSKNLVDSELIMAQLKSNNIELVDDENECETVIINTCGFIKDAKEESIETILNAVKKKKESNLKNLFVVGCLSDRYKSELEKDIPEVDEYFGSTDKPQTLVSILNELGVNYKKDLIGERILTTPSHFAYLKISEGCDNPCSFCSIPIMRGKHVSKPLEEILIEAKKLSDKGVKELIIIAQDTTYWGMDVNGKRELSKVLNELSMIEGFEWIRLMYAYPSRFPHDVIEVIKARENICNYIDIPIQHVSDNVLNSMRRGITSRNQISLLEKFRKEIPGVAIRTSLMVGYPVETEKEFNELLDFVRDFKFDRLGVFTYSEEDDTISADLLDGIPLKEKQLRQRLILDEQRKISLSLNEECVGKVLKVIVDRKENDYYIGRTYKDAPEIDQEVFINYNENIMIGNFYDVKIFDCEEFDLFGEIIN